MDFQEQIGGNLEDLQRTMSVTPGFLEHLLRLGGISIEEKERLLQETPESDWVTVLLNIVVKRGPSSEEALIEALEETDQSDVIVMLRGEADLCTDMEPPTAMLSTESGSNTDETHANEQPGPEAEDPSDESDSDASDASSDTDPSETIIDAADIEKESECVVSNVPSSVEHRGHPYPVHPDVDPRSHISERDDNQSGLMRFQDNNEEGRAMYLSVTSQMVPCGGDPLTYQRTNSGYDDASFPQSDTFTEGSHDGFKMGSSFRYHLSAPKTMFFHVSLSKNFNFKPKKNLFGIVVGGQDIITTVLQCTQSNSKESVYVKCETEISPEMFEEMARDGYTYCVTSNVRSTKKNEPQTLMATQKFYLTNTFDNQYDGFVDCKDSKDGFMKSMKKGVQDVKDKIGFKTKESKQCGMALNDIFYMVKDTLRKGKIQAGQLFSIIKEIETSVENWTKNTNLKSDDLQHSFKQILASKLSEMLIETTEKQPNTIGGDPARCMALAMVLVTLTEDLGLRIEDKTTVSTVCKSLNIRPDMASRRCLDFEGLKNENFPESSKLGKDLQLFLCKAKVTSEYLGCIPLIHFLNGDCKPFGARQKYKSGNIREDKWWGTANLDEKLKKDISQYIKGLRTSHRSLNEIKKTMPQLFEIDPLFERTLLRLGAQRDSPIPKGVFSTDAIAGLVALVLSFGVTDLTDLKTMLEAVSSQMASLKQRGEKEIERMGGKESLVLLWSEVIDTAVVGTTLEKRELPICQNIKRFFDLVQDDGPPLSEGTKSMIDKISMHWLKYLLPVPQSSVITFKTAIWEGWMEMLTIKHEPFKGTIRQHLKTCVDKFSLDDVIKHIGFLEPMRASDKCGTLDEIMRPFKERYPDMTLSIMEKPKNLIETLDDGKLRVSKTGLEELEQLKGKLVVVSIVGLYRTGKSYLLNRLAGKSAGFALGATIESKTKGIWIWVRKHPVLKDTHLVLLDTEGLGDAKKGDLHHDNWVFTLATLLSSTLIYNLIGCVNEEVISKLDFITEISKKIMVRKGGGTNDSEFDLVFPQFVMALRDFSLVLEEDGKEITANQYLEGLLELDSKKGEQFNRPRATIRKYFKNRACFTFDRPGSKRTLQNLEKVSDEKISEDFLENTRDFLKYAFDKFAPMKLRNGHPVNGKNFALMAETYVQAINAGDVPCIERAFELVVKKGNEDAMELSIDLYNAYMGNLELPLKNEDELAGYHKEAMEIALKNLRDTVVGEVKQKFLKQFNENIRSAYLTALENDEKKSTEQSQKTLNEYGKEIMRKLYMKDYLEEGGYSKYKHDVEALEGEYRKHAKGVSVDAVWSKYLLDRLPDVTEIRDKDRQLTMAQRQREEAEARAQEEKRNVAKAEAELERNRKSAEEMRNDYIETQKKMHVAHEEKMLEVMSKQSETYNQRLVEEKRLLEEGFEKRAEEERKNIVKLNREREEEVRQAKQRERDLMERLDRMEKTFRESQESQKREKEERQGRGFFKRIWMAATGDD